MRDQLQESQLSRKKSLGVVVGFHREESAQPVGFCFLTGEKRWIFLHGMCTILVFPRRRLSPQLSLLLCACDRMPPAVLEGSLVVPGLGEVETGSPISLELPLPCQEL